MAYETIAEAAGALDVTPSLEECLETYPILQAAWDRGQFLRKFRLGVSSGAVVAHIARKLDMEPTALRDLIKTDRIVADIYETESFRVDMSIQAGYLKSAAAGDVSATGIARIERLFRDRFEGEPTGGRVGVDIERVPQELLCKLLGVSRQTTYEWRTSRGMPVNVDGSYNLKDVLAWHRVWTEQKLVTTGSRPVMPGGATRMQAAKAHKIELEVGELEGRLWRREEVIDHWIAQAQVLANTLSRQTAVEMGHKLAGRTEEEVTVELERLFRHLRSEMANLPGSVTLPEGVQAAYEGLMGLLGVEGTEETTETKVTEGGSGT